MIIEVIRNPIWDVVTVCVLLVCLTALTFIAVVLMCGLRPDELAKEGVL
jgi:hypothetical protein